MNITFTCPHCSHDVRQDVDAAAGQLVCPACHEPIRLPAGAIERGRLSRCLVCPSTDLFVRKDFPQRLGVGLVGLGVIGSSISWGFGWPITTFAILFATALLDVVLYMIVPNALMCYRCGAQYRQVEGLDQHGAFDLEVHERHRQAKHRGRARGAVAERR
ncbi:MAG TPA: hypothetical protein VMF30_19595 [Pirellulales bacterium]|nr:hypothetical protein [Pirellulales bacterium]